MVFAVTFHFTVIILCCNIPSEPNKENRDNNQDKRHPSSSTFSFPATVIRTEGRRELIKDVESARIISITEEQGESNNEQDRNCSEQEDNQQIYNELSGACICPTKEA